MRALTDAERLVLEAMILHAPAFDPVFDEPSAGDRARWLAMVQDLSVHEMCDCGTCPTIDLAYKGVSSDPKDADSRMVLEAGVEDAIVLLFIDDDVPSCLEVAPLGDDPVLLPTPSEITFG